MPQYRVINRYRDKSSGKRVEPGTIVTLAKPAGDRMVARGLVQPIERQRQPETAIRAPDETAARQTQPATPKHVGGGWYELPGGERVQGKEAAMKRMRG